MHWKLWSYPYSQTIKVSTLLMRAFESSCFGLNADSNTRGHTESSSIAETKHDMQISFSHIIQFVCLFVCLDITSLLNIWGHIRTVPACSSGALTKVLPHRNAMSQTQDMTPHPVTVYQHRANLSLCYPLMWNVTLEYTTTHFNVLSKTFPDLPHTPANAQLGRKCIAPTGSWTRDLWSANPLHYPIAHSCFFILFRQRPLFLSFLS